MIQHRFSTMLDSRSDPDQAAFVACPACFVPNASQQWIYQKAYEQAQKEVTLMTLRRRIYAVSVN
jgi:hypothetical protein